MSSGRRQPTYAELLANSNSNNENEVVENERLKSIREFNKNKLRKKQVFSPLKASMFNATADPTTKVTLPLKVWSKGYAAQPSSFKSKTINTYTIKVVQIKGVYGRFQSAFEITPEYGYVEKTKTNPQLSALDFKIKVSKGSGVTKVTSLTLFKNGKIRMSGGYVGNVITNQPEITKKFILDTFTDGHGQKVSPLKFNNVSATFKYGYRYNLDIGDGGANYGKYRVITFDSKETAMALEIKVKSPAPAFSIKLFYKNYVGEILGVNNPDQLKQAYKNTKELLNLMFSPKGKLQSVNVASNFQSKTAKRLNNMPAPLLVTRRGTTCPKPRHPDPYSFQGRCPQGTSHFVKPNPQGQPCCYKKPRTINYSKKKVVEAYKKANVKVPTTVRNFFNVGAAAETKKNNVSNTRLTNQTLRTFNDPKVGFKIGTRQCVRYSKVALIDIAKRLGIPGLNTTKNLTKPRLCEMIRDRSKTTGINKSNESVGGNLAVSFKNKGNTSMSVTGNSANKVRVGKRFCKSYLKGDLIRFALKLRIPGVSEGLTKDEICAKIFEKTTEKRNVLVQRVATENRETRRVAQHKENETGQRKRAQINKEKAQKQKNFENKQTVELKRLGLNATNLVAEFRSEFRNNDDVENLMNKFSNGFANLPSSSRTRLPTLTDIKKLKKRLIKQLHDKQNMNFAAELERSMMAAQAPLLRREPEPKRNFVEAFANVEEI